MRNQHDDRMSRQEDIENRPQDIFYPDTARRILRKHMKHQVFIIILYSNTYAYKHDIVFEKEDHRVIPIKRLLTEL